MVNPFSFVGYSAREDALFCAASKVGGWQRGYRAKSTVPEPEEISIEETYPNGDRLVTTIHLGSLKAEFAFEELLKTQVWGWGVHATNVDEEIRTFLIEEGDEQNFGW